jgi:hypothetical protein
MENLSKTRRAKRRRNSIAADLRTPKYKSRVVEDRTIYNRKKDKTYGRRRHGDGRDGDDNL